MWYGKSSGAVARKSTPIQEKSRRNTYMLIWGSSSGNMFLGHLAVSLERFFCLAHLTINSSTTSFQKLISEQIS